MIFFRSESLLLLVLFITINHESNNFLFCFIFKNKDLLFMFNVINLIFSVKF